MGQVRTQVCAFVLVALGMSVAPQLLWAKPTNSSL